MTLRNRSMGMGKEVILHREKPLTYVYSYAPPFPVYYGLIFLLCNLYRLLPMFEPVIRIKCIKKFVVK